MRLFRFQLLFAAVLAVVIGPLRAAQIDTYGKLEIKADDGSFSARVTGRLHLDGNFYRSGSEETQLRSGMFVSQARIGVEGNFREWEYEVETDFAANQAKLKSGKIRRVVGPGKLTLGQFKVFEGLEEDQSTKHSTLMERAYLSNVAPGFKIGAGYNGTVGLLGFEGTLYNLREAADDEDRPTNDGLGGVIRAYFVPVNQKTLAVHIGGNVAHERTDVEGQRVRVSPIGRAEEFRNEEEFRFEIYDQRDARARINRRIGEIAMLNGPATVQAEFLDGNAKNGVRPNDEFSAWYAQASYVLTGESRGYVFRRGRMTRPDPSRAWGAVEIAGRYQQAKRKTEPNAELKATELGVTYYANMNVRFMVNYGWSYNKLIIDKPRLLSTRVQFDF